MRLLATLASVVVVARLSIGGASTTIVESTVTSNEVAESIQAEKIFGDEMKRALRSAPVDTAGSKDSEEERFDVSAKVIAAFSEEALNEAFIRSNAEQFTHWNTQSRVPLDVYSYRMDLGDSHDEAMEWGLRYEEYVRNPSRYH